MNELNLNFPSTDQAVLTESAQPITSRESNKILETISRESYLWDNAPEIVDSYLDGTDFIVEMDNSNPTYIASLKDALCKVCNVLDIDFDSETNENGFYGRTYTFYHYDDDEDAEGQVLTESGSMTAEDKVVAWANGNRKENVKACKDNKLNNYKKIAQDIIKKYQAVVDQIDNELASR